MLFRSHEITHVANGDMVTLTLIQGVVNTFVVFLSRVIGYLVDSFLRRNDESSSGPGIGYMVTSLVCEIVFGIAASIIVAYFSRQREFRADAGAAQLMGRKQPMINALARLGGMTPGELPKSVAAMGIAGGIGQLFSTHPPIEERIAALQAAKATPGGARWSSVDAAVVAIEARKTIQTADAVVVPIGEHLARFDRPFLTLFSDSDPATRGWETIFAERVPGARGQPHAVQARAGHFWQEDNGEEAARIIAGWIASTG